MSLDPSPQPSPVMRSMLSMTGGEGGPRKREGEGEEKIELKRSM